MGQRLIISENEKNQIAGMHTLVNEQNEEEVIKLIGDIASKLPADVKSRMVIMNDFDEEQMVLFFRRLMGYASAYFREEPKN